MAPKKNKKPGKNGFWQFVLETRDKNTNRNMSMQELQDYAARKWANMSKEERGPYEGLAALARNDYRAAKLTTDGLEIDEVERQEQNAEERLRSMKKNILANLKACSVGGTLDDQRFLIIHINHLIYYPAGDKYFICELAVCAFSLKNGIEDVFHRIVKPGKLPLGFYGGAKTHSKETHQMIEIVQDEPYEDNTKEVFYDLINFMKKFSDNKKLPILYADDKTFEMTNKVFDNFQQELNFPEDIKIYNLQSLFFALRNAAAGKNVWPTETFSYSEIEKDVYAYCPNISCDFHEVSDISVYCSKSVVIRYAFTICDNCCSDRGIALLPGCHVPEKSRIHTDLNVNTRFNSKASSVNSINEMGTTRRDSFSSRGYDENYPPLGGSKSSASSVISFSSMRTPTERNGPSTSRNVVGLENALNQVSLNAPNRNPRTLKLPEQGWKRSVRDKDF